MMRMGGPYNEECSFPQAQPTRRAAVPSALQHIPLSTEMDAV